MIRNVWAVLCKVALEDRRTRDVSLINAVNQFTANIAPEASPPFGVFADFALVSTWGNTDADNPVSGSLSLSIITPTGKEIHQVTQECEINPMRFNRWFINIAFMEIVGEGRYTFVLRAKEKDGKKWKRGATLPLDVVFNFTDHAPELTTRQA